MPDIFFSSAEKNNHHFLVAIITIEEKEHRRMMTASFKRTFNCKTVRNSSMNKNNRPFDIFDRGEHKNSNIQWILSTMLRITFQSLQLFLIVERVILHYQQTKLSLPFLLLCLLFKRQIKTKKKRYNHRNN